LDALRGIAIFMVLLFHCMTPIFDRQELDWKGLWRTTTTEPRHSFYLFYPITFGWAGVSLFFVLSGFVIHASFFRTKKFSVASFYWRRFWRIYPPYLLALIGCTAILWTHDPDHRAIVKQFVMHFFVIHNFRDWSYYGISPPFWSLATEMQFYLLYPLLLLLRWRVGMKNTLLIVLAISCATRGYCYAVTDWTKPVSDALWHNTLNVWFDWTLGMYLAEQFHFGHRVFNRGRVPLVIFLLGVMFAFHLYAKTNVLIFTVTSLISAIVLESSLYSKPILPPIRPFLISLGVCSYSFYLWHAELLRIIADKTHVVRLPISGIQFIVLATISLFSIYAFSYFLYVAVEKPSQRVGKWIPWGS
jgi:peptidoglycan/LPS O-acetylase OafA/YrhL